MVRTAGGSDGKWPCGSVVVVVVRHGPKGLASLPIHITALHRLEVTPLADTAHDLKLQQRTHHVSLSQSKAKLQSHDQVGW